MNSHTSAKILLMVIKLFNAPMWTNGSCCAKSILSDDSDAENIPVEWMSDESMNDSEFKTLINRTSINSWIERNPELNKFIENVKFKYWTLLPNNESSSIGITLKDTALIMKKWIPNKPLKVIIHGWRCSDRHETGVFVIKRAYLEQKEQYNVISVDWSFMSKSIRYRRSASSCNKIGVLVCHLLINLEDLGLVTPDIIHLIGHSLGAHIAGTAGSTYIELKKKKIARITGLDPPALGFMSASIVWNLNHRLDSEDAMFVDIIKTTKGFMRISIRIGHAEFHPNDGQQYQPGCELQTAYKNWICSHRRAFHYYAESIRSCKYFESLKCPSFIDFIMGLCKDFKKSHMGHYAITSNHGDYYLFTKEDPPYHALLPEWED